MQSTQTEAMNGEAITLESLIHAAQYGDFKVVETAIENNKEAVW